MNGSIKFTGEGDSMPCPYCGDTMVDMDSTGGERHSIDCDSWPKATMHPGVAFPYVPISAEKETYTIRRPSRNGKRRW